MDGWEEDAFRQSGTWKCKLRSRDSKYLTLNGNGHFQFENFTGEQFTIYTYQSTALDEGTHRGAVMLYVSKGQQKMVACCRNDSEVYAKAMEPPTDLNETSDEALFYMERLSAHDTYQFQSTLHPGCFLGFQPDDKNASRHKLVLIRGKDNVDCYCPLQMMKKLD
ncbi:interleukin-18-like [Acanthochromis polyacanthus]|uniref:interleukin-18-like n=1 Tax=Acanthochromis polyacanthus TaxID=80966 RepID=UPI0022344ABA|nr:interleukin-18-like [Acanthochromis polyacanthus]